MLVPKMSESKNTADDALPELANISGDQKCPAVQGFSKNRDLRAPLPIRLLISDNTK
jgi:hypothetical protein